MANMSTEYQFHKLSYMQRSLELANVKEEIEGLLRDRHIIDKKLEEKMHEQNDLTDKCVHHLRVLQRKGMTADFYCPKKRGVTVTPVKSNGPYMTPPKPHSYGSSYAPNFVPSPRVYISATDHVTYMKGSSPVYPRGGLVQNYPFRGLSPQKTVINTPVFGASMYVLGNLLPRSPVVGYGQRFVHTSPPSSTVLASKVGVPSGQKWGEQLHLSDKQTGVELIEKCETVPGCGGGAYGGLYPSQLGVNANMLPVSSDRNQGSNDQMTKKLWNSLTETKICQGGVCH